MNKQEFIAALRSRLSGLPKEDVEERLGFYGEMIDDRIEDGLSETEAVRDIGNIDDIASQIIGDIPLVKIAKERIKPKRRLGAWEIVLLAVGSPLWLSLVIVAVAAVLSVYVALWSVIISLWASFGALVGCAVGGIVSGAVLTVIGKYVGIALIGAGIACAGFAIMFFFGCGAATKGIIWLTKRIALGIKSCFIKKEKGNE